jgi:16S rRNA (guanine527-N7)-methyltransferase
VPSDRALIATLTDAQRLGFLGPRPIPGVIAHARGFVRALETDPSVRTVLDLGSGGGVPGLVIANDRPDLHITLLDRRSKRTDFLERVVRRLGWGDRVVVLAAEASAIPNRFDAVVARGFGPPADTARIAARLVREGGTVVVSEPPDEDRWDDVDLAQLGLERIPTPPSSSRPSPSSSLDGRVAVFVRR